MYVQERFRCRTNSDLRRRHTSGLHLGSVARLAMGMLEGRPVAGCVEGERVLWFALL